jgi:retron-type reverse transcriptase
VKEVARSSCQIRFTALLHHVDDAALKRAFRRLRREASAGVDGVTVVDYEQNLDANIRDLCERVHSGRYRPQPVRRTYIPKADGGRRSLDKIVQGAVAEVLSAIYEVDFLGFSYGFRPGRNPHQALESLKKALMTERVNWVLDADITAYFDTPLCAATWSSRSAPASGGVQPGAAARDAGRVRRTGALVGARADHSAMEW